MNDILNVRELRGLDIANRYTIKQENGTWFVPSTSGKSTRYKVDLQKQNCDCPDFEIRRSKCKHIFAVINEALCKILAHNICVLNQSMFELEIKPQFWKEIV